MVHCAGLVEGVGAAPEQQPQVVVNHEGAVTRQRDRQLLQVGRHVVRPQGLL